MNLRNGIQHIAYEKNRNDFIKIAENNQKKNPKQDGQNNRKRYYHDNKGDC